jgi:hypothetical protein
MDQHQQSVQKTGSQLKENFAMLPVTVVQNTRTTMCKTEGKSTCGVTMTNQSVKYEWMRGKMSVKKGRGFAGKLGPSLANQ